MLKKLIQCLEDTWNFFRNNLAALCWITLPLWAIANGSYFFKDELSELQQFKLLGFLLAGAAMVLYQGALIAYLSSVTKGSHVSAFESYRIAFSFFVPLLLVSLGMTLPVLVGMIFLIVPGVYVFARLSFAPIYSVLFKEPLMACLNMSWKQTDNDKWLLFWGIIGIYLFTALIGNFLDIIFSFSSALYLLLTLPVSLLATTLTTLTTIFVFRVFTLNNHSNDQPLTRISN